MPGNEAPDCTSIDWLAPGQPVNARDALHRIERICGLYPNLFGAMFCVAATHPGVPREQLARAIKQCRPDTEAFSVQDVVGLLTALNTGAHEGFDAVLRSRKKGERRAVGLSAWVKTD